MDKGYIDGALAKWMRMWDGDYVAIKRKNMIKTKERLYYRFLSRVRKLIETTLSHLEEYGLRYVRVITRRGIAIKIITTITAFNIYQLMEAFDGNKDRYKYYRRRP